VVAAGTVSVIMVLTSREHPLAPGNPAPAAGAPSRSLCHVLLLYKNVMG
jgi:hypothetical protein